jgi:hypothetical protein
VEAAPAWVSATLEHGSPHARLSALRDGARAEEARAFAAPGEEEGA